MPQQYMLINRPVILSKHKINVISQEGPPIPIGSVRSMSSYAPRLVVKGSMFTKHGNSVQSCHQLQPAVSLVEYQKSVQDNLISINNNLSDMLKETISGIDIICKKVRLCLLDANSVSTIKMDNSKLDMSKPLMSICEENVNKVENIEEEVIEEIVEEENPAPDEETDKFEDEVTIEDEITIEDETIIEAETQKSLKNLNSSVPNSAETQKRNTGLTPFFTILNPKTLSAESVAVNRPSSITSKLGLSRKCTAENFQKSMHEVAQLKNYEKFLSHMVNDVNEGIDRYYKHYKEEYKSKEMNGRMDERLSNSSLKRQDSRRRYRRVSSKIKEKIRKLQGDESIQMEQDYDENGDIRSRHRMMTCNIKDKIERLQDAFNIRATKKSSDVSLGNISFPCGEVYRKRAFTDLHKRMNVQVEANDSLLFFQKLMDKNQKHMIETPKKESGKRPSDISLPRSPLQQILISEKRQRQNKRYTDLATMYQDSLWFKGKSREEKRAKKESIRCKKRLEGTSSKNEKYLPKTYTVKSVSNVQDKSHSTKSIRKSLKHLTKSVVSVPISKTTKISSTKYEISITNNQPLSEPERCKMYWMRSKYAQLTKKKLQYMDILDDITNKDILPLKSEYPRRDQVVKRDQPNEKVDDVKQSYLYKLLHAEENEKVWTELLKPTIKCSNVNCGEIKVFGMSEEKNLDKDNIRKTLSKYIFADIDQMQKNQVYTVMPVQISYDNSRLACNLARSELRPRKLPLMPMIETKDNIRRAEWTLENNKKPKPVKVVYDPILKKIEKEIKMVSGRQHESEHTTPKTPTTTSWSSKNFNQLYTTTRQSWGFKTVKIDSLDKAPKKQQSKIAPNQACKAAKLMERRPQKPLVANRKHSPIELDMEKKIQKELEIQSLKLRNVQERKIWENKYGKSVGQKLLNFVEKQPSAYEIPVPKYALPKTIKDPIKQRHMLEQLRELKQKNDNIQNNILKAIGVIENKMMDVLCKPAGSSDAFEKMEKEITHVLSLMKTCKEASQQDASPQTGEPYCDINQLTEDLFKRLDTILEKPEKEEKIDQKPKRKMKAKGPQRSKVSDMKTVCFSSTSPSGEEKFTITAISPKRSSKRPVIPPPKIIMPTVTTKDEEFDAINSELRKLREELGLHRCSDQLGIELLEAIEENEPGKMVDRKKQPINEPVVNVALVKHKSAGDTKDNAQTSQKGSPLYIIGDGRSKVRENSGKTKESTGSALSNNTVETQSSQYVIASSQELGYSNRQFSNIETQQLGSQRVVADEEMPLEGCTEVSEQYYTPITTPLVGYREVFPEVDPYPFDSELTKPLEALNKDASSADQECFYDNVNKIIARVESVYSQLAQFEEVGLDGLRDPKIPVFQDLPKIEEFEADSFLTPFMHAVKDLRKSVAENPKSDKSSPRLYRSPSYFNVLSFLDTLTDLEERVVEIRTARVLHYSYPSHNSTVFEQATIKRQCITIIRPVQEPNHLFECQENSLSYSSMITAEKLSECLEKTSSHLSIVTATSNTSSQDGEIYDPKEMSVCLEKTSSNLSMITATSTIQSDDEETDSGCLKKTLSNLSMITATSTIHSENEDIHVPKQISGCLKKPISHPSITAMSCESVEMNVPKKMSGCLKKRSSHLSVTETTSKSKQKVSFYLEKEEKATQVMECPVHNLSSQECLSCLSLLINNNTQDEQVSAYLDALESKSVDKMSLTDDDDSFLSNFDLSNDISLQPEQIIENSLETEDEKKNIEIFRNNIPEEKYKGNVKVFYDNYNNTDDNFDFPTQIVKGTFNETSIQQAKKFKNIQEENSLRQTLKESSLLEPLKDVHNFIDTKLLKDTIGKRQKIRMTRKKSGTVTTDKTEKCCPRDMETFLKGVYICLYVFMFTALKLNINAECRVD